MVSRRRLGLGGVSLVFSLAINRFYVLKEVVVGTEMVGSALLKGFRVLVLVRDVTVAGGSGTITCF